MISDLIIAASYFVLPLVLLVIAIYVLRTTPTLSLEVGLLHGLFILFILSCGIGHLLMGLGINSSWSIITAISSFTTATVSVIQLPRLLNAINRITIWYFVIRAIRESVFVGDCVVLLKWKGDTCLTVLWANQAVFEFARDNGFNGDILGGNWYEIFPDIAPRWKAIHRAIATGKEYRAKAEEDYWNGIYLSWEIVNQHRNIMSCSFSDVTTTVLLKQDLDGVVGVMTGGNKTDVYLEELLKDEKWDD